ncbi:hypothetical protein [Alicyclobacillus dauci]|uniref:Uncharacterized protein n=1 Tax=Alicyclobacillus dauci TaxID=1475485 RepID=A0ABY6Z2U0_9BACL|nr:hypothetical protein [Alicyclobacillus dauci]WAH37157.1 hypothetical protein NZD86_00975 [Alicyclobacillus dauci]
MSIVEESGSDQHLVNELSGMASRQMDNKAVACSGRFAVAGGTLVSLLGSN